MLNQRFNHLADENLLVFLFKNSSSKEFKHYRKLFISNFICKLYLEEIVEDKRSLLHDPDISVHRVGVLAVHYRINEPIHELLPGSQEGRFREVDHLVVLLQVVL